MRTNTMNRTTVKGYGTLFRKKYPSTDPYLVRAVRAGTMVCEGCGAVLQNKRWYAPERLSAAGKAGAMKTHCPACLKVRDKFPGGIVTLKGSYVPEHRRGILSLVRNEEERARGFNPLERVMSVEDDSRGGMVISTTNEKLAQRIGRALKKAFRGEVAYHWSHDDKLVRVDWVRQSL